MSVFILVFAALVGFIAGKLYPLDRLKVWTLSSGLLLLSIIKLIYFLMKHDAYEKGIMSPEGFSGYFIAQQYLVLLFICQIMLLGFIVFMSSTQGKRYFTLIYRFASLLAVTSGIVLMIYVIDPHKWAGGLGYKAWVFPVMLPFLFMAAVEGLRECPQEGKNNDRIKIIKAIGLMFSLVLLVQSTVWFNITKRLRTELSASTALCLSMDSIQGLRGTPLDFWSTPSLAVVFQNKHPGTLLLKNHDCQKALNSNGVQIVPWDLHTGTKGWWDLNPARNK
jgi:hypothetical protein